MWYGWNTLEIDFGPGEPTHNTPLGDSVERARLLARCERAVTARMARYRPGTLSYSALERALEELAGESDLGYLRTAADLLDS